MPDDVAQTPATLPAPTPSSRRKGGEVEAGSERTRLAFLWYRMVQWFFSTLMVATGGLRATGRRNVPPKGAAILVSNHLSHLDVLVLAILLDRPLNFVARSTLFFFPLGPFIRSLGAFPIQRDGIGAQGMKETLRRLKRGGIVTLFPEGTRTRDGELGDLKSGIALLATRAGVPILPAAIAGTFEAWPRSSPLPAPRPIHVHYGQLIPPEQAKSLNAEDLTALIRERILECQAIAREGLARLSAVGDEGD